MKSLSKPARRYILTKPPPTLGPKIISPYTGRPLAEDYIGADIMNKLIRMLEGDKRLSSGMKHEVMVRVIARRAEIGTDAKKLSDVAAYEAENVIRENTH
jgi:hypothetical protein